MLLRQHFVQNDVEFREHDERVYKADANAVVRFGSFWSLVLLAGSASSVVGISWCVSESRTRTYEVQLCADR